MPRAAAPAVLLSLACASTPAPAGTTELQAKPTASAPRGESLKHDQAPTSPAATTKPTAQIAEPGFDVVLRCAPQLCIDKPWLSVDFNNRSTGRLVLDVSAESAATRTWPPTSVSAQRPDGTGFGSVSAPPARSTHYTPSWNGEPLAVDGGDAESFTVFFHEEPHGSLEVELRVSWREATTMSADDARDAENTWVVTRDVGTAVRDGCSSMSCEIKPLDATN